MFCGQNDFYRTKHVRTENGIERVPFTGTMTEKQIRLSKQLKNLFPAYLNSLHLTAPDGTGLTLDESGEGSFLDYVSSFVKKSAQKELDTHDSATRLTSLAVKGSEVETQSWLRIENGCVKSMDWNGFIKAITRMKAAPAFDALDLKSPENEEFGTEEVDAKHFAVFSQENSEVESELADPLIIRMMNPTEYIGQSGTAPHWRIRHGTYDRDTSLAIPVILATLLENRGYDVDFHLPWGLPHSGDYDLDELFAWIDQIVSM
jgi:hypothetical protein